MFDVRLPLTANFSVSGANENACSGISMSAEANEIANTAPRVPSAIPLRPSGLRGTGRRSPYFAQGYEGQVDAPLQAFHWPKFVPSLSAHRRYELPMKPKNTLHNLLTVAGSSLIAMSSANAQSTLYFDGSNSNATANGVSQLTRTDASGPPPILFILGIPRPQTGTMAQAMPHGTMPMRTMRSSPAAAAAINESIWPTTSRSVRSHGRTPLEPCGCRRRIARP